MLDLAIHQAVLAAPRPAARADLLACLDSLNIAHRTIDHPPVFTVAESRDIKLELPGGHTKNLFLKDKRGAFVLVCALAETSVRLNKLHREIGADRLSFASADDLRAVLCVEPGSVTVFALINDRERRVRLVLDEALLRSDPVNFHPLRNDATTAISTAELQRFIAATGRTATGVDFARLADASSSD